MPRTTSKPKRRKPLAKDVAPRPTQPAEGESPRVPQQDRGQRRVDEILDAAEAVIAEVGWEGATTQLIAARAGASMGSLYHFFPTKDAILLALSQRYTRLMYEANERAMPMEAVWLPPEELFERIIGAQVQIKDALPAFVPIYEAMERRFGHEAGPLCEMDQSIHDRVRAFCAIRTPRLTGHDQEASVRLMVGVVHRAMHEASCLPPAGRPAMYAATRELLSIYLRELDRRFGPVPAAAR